MNFEHMWAEQAERKASLMRALTGTPEPAEPTAAQVANMTGAQRREAEQARTAVEPGTLEARIADAEARIEAAQAREQAGREAMGEPAPEPQPEPKALPRVPSFDGGARTTPPLPAPTHDETLAAIFAELPHGGGTGRW